MGPDRWSRIGSALSPRLIALVYFVFGIVALVVSDVLFVAVIEDPARLRRLQAIKGAVEVAFTALLIYGLVAIYRDAAERKTDEVERARDRLAFLNNLLRHHVLNRMNVVQGHVNGLIEHGEGDSERLATIERQSEAIVDLVENVRVLAHAPSGSFEPIEVDVAAVVEAAVETARDRHPEATLEASAPDGIEVEADDALSLVVESLLQNAVAHNDADHPRVSVTVEPGTEYATVRVADNGPGIPEDAIRGPAAGERRGHEGLGLYLVSSLVERYGGEVRIETSEHGGGAVAVVLPRAG